MVINDLKFMFTNCCTEKFSETMNNTNVNFLEMMNDRSKKNQMAFISKNHFPIFPFAHRALTSTPFRSHSPFTKPSPCVHCAITKCLPAFTVRSVFAYRLIRFILFSCGISK